MIPLCAAWAGHNDQSRVWAEDIRTAFAVLGLKHEEAARKMGLTPQDLSAQLAGRDPLNHWRLAYLGPRFEVALFTLRARRLGAEVITPEQVELLRGAARLGPRKLLRAGMHALLSSEERAS
jgi:hypothetical protein